MLNFFRRLSVEDSLIVLILLIGAFLRFYRLPEIPFSHDEFSAIFRTRFLSFHELIEKGVKVDTHPAGVQVFLYYLIRVFGLSEAVLKTPFIIFGLLSVWLVYLIGKDWFNATVGLLAASFVSFLQFPVMYSQIARPYASGLCFAMMMVFFWTKVVFHPQRKYYWNLAGYIISGALCAYNHHFSMLFAAMVGATGLFYCPLSKMRQYVLAGLIVIVLYLPHLQIFFIQLGMGGIEGWLSKPGYDFIIGFIQYIFQFSVYIYLLVIALVMLSFYLQREKPIIRWKFLLISLIWFLVPYLIGFFYSKYRNSVLQYSVLIFSFPFLLFVLFGFFKALKSVCQIILVSLIGIIVIPSLILERQHYRIFYKGVYREIVAESVSAADSLGTGRCTIILDTKKDINRYYLRKLDCTELPFRYLADFSGKGSLLTFLDSCKGDFLAFGCLASADPVYYPMMMEKFPYLLKHKSYFLGDFYLFSKIKPPDAPGEYFFTRINSFDPGLPAWGWVHEDLSTCSLPFGENASFINPGWEFSPTYTFPLRDLIHSENDVVDVSVDFRVPLMFQGARLIESVTSDGKDIKWLSASVNDYVKPGHQGRVLLSMRLSDVEILQRALLFNAYIWNPRKSPFIMDNFAVRARSGNPIIYGLYRKIGQ